MEKENQKKNKKVMLIAIVVVLVLVGVAIVGVYGYDLKQKEVLTSEVNDLVENVDLTTDTIDVEDIKSTGKYAEVEKAIKTYLNNCGTEMQKIIELAQDERLSKLLSIDNIKQDGPDFNESLPYIEETLQQLQTSSETAITLMEKEEMIKYIDSYNLSNKYKKLFETLMLDEETEKDLKKSQTELKDAVDKLKGTLEVAKETLEFLKENKSSWSVESNRIMFDSQALLNQYNTLVRKLN